MDMSAGDAMRQSPAGKYVVRTAMHRFHRLGHTGNGTVEQWLHEPDHEVLQREQLGEISKPSIRRLIWYSCVRRHTRSNLYCVYFNAVYAAP